MDRKLFFERFETRGAVQNFYEPFLRAYDPRLRKELGVWSEALGWEEVQAAADLTRGSSSGGPG